MVKSFPKYSILLNTVHASWTSCELFKITWKNETNHISALHVKMLSSIKETKPMYLLYFRSEISLNGTFILTVFNVKVSFHLCNFAATFSVFYYKNGEFKALGW